MPRWNPVPYDFVVALRVLDAVGLPYAESWRRLHPVAARIGHPRPSYWWVRRFLIAERRRKGQRMEVLDRVLYDLMAGLVPRGLR